MNFRTRPMSAGGSKVSSCCSWICPRRLFIHHKLSFEDWWWPNYQNEHKKSRLFWAVITFNSFFWVGGGGGGVGGRVQVNIFTSSDFVKLNNSLKTWTPLWRWSSKLILYDYFWQFNSWDTHFQSERNSNHRKGLRFPFVFKKRYRKSCVKSGFKWEMSLNDFILSTNDIFSISKKGIAKNGISHYEPSFPQIYCRNTYLCNCCSVAKLSRVRFRMVCQGLFTPCES